MHDPVLFAAGVAFLFLGWLLYTLTLQLSAAFLIGVGGLTIASWVGERMELGPYAILSLRLGGFLLGAIIGVFVGRLAHTLAFLVIGVPLGVAVFLRGVDLWSSLGQQWVVDDLVIAFGIPVAGVFGAVLMAVLARYVVCIALAALGAVMVWQGWDPAAPAWWAIGLFPLGLAVQLALGRPWNDPKERPRARRRRSRETEDEDAED